MSPLPKYDNATAVGGRGAGIAFADSGMQTKYVSPYDQVQWRLSGFALALEAIFPDLAYLEHAVELTIREVPLPGDGRNRLHRLSLKLFDLRQVLEAPIPEVLSER